VQNIGVVNKQSKNL